MESAAQDSSQQEWEQHRRSRAGEERMRQKTAALVYWSQQVGVLPRFLEQQLPGMLDEFGLPKMMEAFDLVAQKSGPRAPSKERFSMLVRILRDWRRAKK